MVSGSAFEEDCSLFCMSGADEAVFETGFPIVGIRFCEDEGTQSEKARDDISIFLVITIFYRGIDTNGRNDLNNHSIDSPLFFCKERIYELTMDSYTHLMDMFVNMLPLLLLFTVLVFPAQFTAFARTFLGKASLVLCIPLLTAYSIFLGTFYCIFLILYYQFIYTPYYAAIIQDPRFAMPYLR